MPSLKSSVKNNQHMSLDDVCSLISVSSVRDELGQNIETESERQIFCARTSVSRAEFLAAGQLNHKPQITIVVDSEEYDGEMSLKYGNIKYRVYRDYMRPDGYTDLHCEVRSG